MWTIYSILYLFHLYFNVLFPLLLTGQEYAAIVEFAPFQKAAKKKSKKKDAKTGTIEDGITSLLASLFCMCRVETLSNNLNVMFLL